MQSDLQKSFGFSLVELLIAMTLSLFLMSGLVQAYLSNARTFQLSQEQILLQENGRFALQFIEMQIRRAGFIRNIDLLKITNRTLIEQQIFPQLDNFDNSNAVFSKGVVITGLDNVSLDSLKPDTDIVHVRYQHSEQITFKDCMNNNLDSGLGQTVIISYFVDENNTLRCRGARDSAGRRRSAALVEGIEDLQVLYGVDTTGDGTANKYVAADEILQISPNDSEWRYVVTVKVAILVNSGSGSVNRSPSEEQEFDVLGEQRRFSDGKNRTVFAQVIGLKNAVL